MEPLVRFVDSWPIFAKGRRKGLPRRVVAWAAASRGARAPTQVRCPGELAARRREQLLARVRVRGSGEVSSRWRSHDPARATARLCGQM